MSLFEAYSWPYGGDPESQTRSFFAKLREGNEKGIEFPFSSDPHQIALVTSKSDTWFVGILVFTNSTRDDSVEIVQKLEQWFKQCDAGSYQDRESLNIVGQTIQRSLGEGYTIIDELRVKPKTAKFEHTAVVKEQPTAQQAGQPAIQGSQSQKAAIEEQKKVGCWVWPMLVLGALLSIAGFCLGAIIVYGQISGTTGDPVNVGTVLSAIGCFSLSPLIIGLGLLGISIFTLLRKGKPSSPLQSTFETKDTSGSQQKVEGNGEVSSMSNEEPPSHAKTVEGILFPDESTKISKVIVSFQDPGPLSGLKGIEFLLDGISKGLLQFTDIKEFKIPAGEHIAKMVLYGAVKRSSKELRFSLKEGQIVCIEGEIDNIWGGINIRLARDQSLNGKLIELQKKVSESICNVCDNKSLNGETAIVITANKVGEKTERVGNNINKIYTYNDFHRIRVFICSDCKKDKKSFEKAVTKKDNEFGRIGELSYWRSKDFPYTILPAGDVAYFFIKDKMKDELDDRTQNKNVTLNFHSPRKGGLNASQFQGGIWIDEILIALLSYEKGFDVSINVVAGKHTIGLGGGAISRLTIYAEENKTYEFDCKASSMGGIKPIPRFPAN